MIGEAAVKLGFQGLPKAAAMQQIARAIPQTNVSGYLKEIALESLRGVEEIRARLAEQYDKLTIIGKGEGRHPDLAGTVRPDFIALSERNSEPIIIEAKDSTRASPTDKFQAMFYNGIAERFGVYLLEERLEGEQPVFRPRLVESKAETVLVYPRLAEYPVVKEKFVPEEPMIKEIWKSKELGFKGLVPETDCGKKCAHRRLKVDLPEGNMEPLLPPPLIFSKGILERGNSLDTNYQVNYAWNLLPSEIRHVLHSFPRDRISGLDVVKDWLVNVGGLDDDSADIVLDPGKLEAFNRSKPNAEALLDSMKGEFEPWERILRKRLRISAPSILARATAVYSLPKRSFRFVKDAWDRWH